MLRDVYLNARVVDSGSYLTTVNELCDQSPALRPELLQYVAGHLVAAVNLSRCTKLLTEEEKGATIATALSLRTGLPLAMARQYPYAVSAHLINFTSEYSAGSLCVNGIEPGDVVCIVDDTLSTGGTIAALVDAVQGSGAKVEAVAVVVEKVRNGGRQMLEQTRGVSVTSLLQIDVTCRGVTVLSGVA